MDADRPGSRIRFGAFEVDMASGELRSHGQRIRIQPQPMKVLVVLLERPGELVTRDELQKRLWPGELFVDFEHGLNRSINKLRHTLLDDASSPRYIQTLSTRGYCFIGKVDSEPKPGAPDSTVVVPSSGEAQLPAPSNWRRRLILTTGVLIVLALIFVSAWRPHQTSAEVSVFGERLQPVPLVTLANGSPWLPAFSPDGSRLAYSWRTDSGWYLEVKDVGTDTHLRLTQRAADFPPGPAWSPDGRQIAYARAGAEDRGIFIVSALGGPERKLRSLSQWYVPQRIVSWSPDGNWIAYSDDVDGMPGAAPGSGAQHAIFLISPDTSETRQLTHPPAKDFGDSAPTFSPDGATIAFVRTKADSHDEIYTIPIDGGTPRRLITAGLWTNGLAWEADGTSILFDRSLAGGFRLWKVSSTGGDPHPLDIPSKGETFLEPTLWRDHLAYESHFTAQTVGRISLNALPSEVPATPVASTRSEQGGRYSPDGQRIAFISDRTGSAEVWMADPDGANPVQLTRLGTPLIDLSWNPNGNSIAFSAYSGKVYEVSLGTRGVRTLLEGAAFTDEGHNIAFSRNGNFLYVLSQPGTGRSYDLLRVPIAGGTPAKVMSGRLTNFAESADGRMLFYSRSDGLWKRPLDGGEEQYVAPANAVWDLRPDGLYFATSNHLILRISLDGKRARTVAQLGPSEMAFPLSISPDGRLALFGYVQRKTVEIDMVQGFN